MKIKRKVFSVGKNLIMILISLAVLLPMIMILVNSFKTRPEALSMSLALPKVWQPQNFALVMEQGKLLQSFLNSMIYSVSAVIISVMLASLASFVLNRNRSTLNKILYYIIILGITIPVNFVTLMKVMQALSLNNSRLGLVLLYSAMQIPFSVFLIYGFVGGIPKSMDEAAVIDGCGTLRLFFSVILPMLKPVVVTAATLNFLNVWNEFILPLYFTNSSTKWPMTLSIYNFFGMYQADWQLVCADIVLTSLPVLIVYLIGQKYIISGMTSGAVKE